MTLKNQIIADFRRKNPFSIRKIRGNLSHPRYQRRIPRADDVNYRFDEADVHNSF